MSEDYPYLAPDRMVTCMHAAAAAAAAAAVAAGAALHAEALERVSLQLLPSQQR